MREQPDNKAIESPEDDKAAPETDFAESSEDQAEEPEAAPVPPPPLPKSYSGATLDPVDHQPIFGEFDGVMVSRERYLELTRNAAKDRLVDELRASVEEDLAAASEAEAALPSAAQPPAEPKVR